MNPLQSMRYEYELTAEFLITECSEYEPTPSLVHLSNCYTNIFILE